MTRRCSHCSSNGHNSRTAPGVRLTDGSIIKKSASMGDLPALHYQSSSSAAASPNPPGSLRDALLDPTHVPEEYLSDDPAHASCSTNRRVVRKKGTPWTEEVHQMFLLGLQKLGKSCLSDDPAYASCSTNRRVERKKGISMDTKLERRCTSSLKPKSSSSSQEVLNDQDLLTLILLHVPWKRLVSLKCVSRQWHSLIITPHFRTLLPPLRASGLFFQLPDEFSYDHNIAPHKVCFVPLDNPNIPSPFRNLTFAHDPFDPEQIHILQSCNGLLLCSSAFSSPNNQYNHYVYNPSTNQLATLPKHPLDTGDSFDHVGLTFDPSKSIHYKVIAFVSTSWSPSHYTGDFYIYSSETGTWKASVQSFTAAPGMYFDYGVYWTGCMNWLSTFRFQEQSELSISDCLYFNVDEESLGTFPRPPIGASEASMRSGYFGESEGHLHVIEIRPCAASFNVYEMKSDYSEWFVKYRIGLDPISKVFPEMKYKLCNGFSECRYTYKVDVLSLIRRENFQEDSFLVLKIHGKAIRYNLVDGSFKLIRDFSPQVTGDMSLGSLHVWKYIESLSCV